MVYRTADLDLATFKRIYSSVYAAIERTNLLYGTESYLTGTIRDEAASVQTTVPPEPSVEILILVKSDCQWKELIRHLTKKEMFYQGKENADYFYRRGSRIRLTPVQHLDDDIDKSAKIG